MPKFKVNSPIKYDGARCEVGELVEIEKRYAKPLLQAGAIEPESEPRGGTGGGGNQRPSDKDLLRLLDAPVQQIVEVIAMRDSDGTPRASTEDLTRLRKIEEGGKARRTLIDAIDTEIASREAAAQT